MIPHWTKDLRSHTVRCCFLPRPRLSTGIRPFLTPAYYSSYPGTPVGHGHITNLTKQGKSILEIVYLKENFPPYPPPSPGSLQALFFTYRPLHMKPPAPPCQRTGGGPKNYYSEEPNIQPGHRNANNKVQQIQVVSSNSQQTVCKHNLRTFCSLISSPVSVQHCIAYKFIPMLVLSRRTVSVGHKD